MTYSIVARDPEANELGVAVASHVLAVGVATTWVRPAVGVVVTQANMAPHYGPDLLAALVAGTAPDAALRAVTAPDSLALSRQAAIIDAEGRMAVHDGERCTKYAGHAVGDTFSCQGNMLRVPGIPEAMAEAFEGAEGSLALRLLAALDAGEGLGGDLRGRQSAAVVVVSATRDERSLGWISDLRVDDHPEPLVELRRLVELQEAQMLPGDIGGERVFELGRGNPEAWFWRGIARANRGDFDGARAALEHAFRVSDDWRELLRRMPFMLRNPADLDRLL